jgi:hypothetical protein
MQPVTQRRHVKRNSARGILVPDLHDVRFRYAAMPQEGRAEAVDELRCSSLASDSKPNLLQNTR